MLDFIKEIREDGTVIPKADLEKIAKRRLGEAGIFGGTAGKDDQSAFIAEFDTKKEAIEWAHKIDYRDQNFIGTMCLMYSDGEINENGEWEYLDIEQEKTLRY